MEPLVSIIIPTYNREHTLQRTIESILQQTYKNIELIIVDNVSTDNTLIMLQKYKEDQRLRVFEHTENRGVCASKNTGLEHIRGEWFTILDSDDEIVPHAIETLLKPWLEKDTEITAVTCNCIDYTTGQFTGTGINHNRYIDNQFIRKNLFGEFWGLTKTQLLDKDRFNENLPGIEDVLWDKINKRAKRYYIHVGLRIYHREGSDRITFSNKRISVKEKARIYRAFTEELDYLKDLADYTPVGFIKFCVKGFIFSRKLNDHLVSRFYKELLAGRKFNYNPLYMLAGKAMLWFIPLIELRMKFSMKGNQ
jgi:GalNAc5-diNAcBac-PP-undecaprenol beta-1,3-glucosyltransferase